MLLPFSKLAKAFSRRPNKELAFLTREWQSSLNYKERYKVYLHAVYPYKDLFQRRGLWKTIAKAQHELQIQHPDEDVHVWIDVPASIIDQLPDEHPFEIDSPWLLYGIDKEAWANLKKWGDVSFKYITPF